MAKKTSTKQSHKEHSETCERPKGSKYGEGSKLALVASRGVIAVLMLVPLIALAILGIVHFNDLRNWRWGSPERWLGAASLIFVVASHVLMLVLVCREPKGEQQSTDQPDEFD